jgi:putative ABC transport system ATP-binding protein
LRSAALTTELCLHDIVRDYRLGEAPVRALRGITLSIRGGEFVSVVGPSGAGKSTLLHIMGGLDRPTSGTVELDGSEYGSLDDDRLSRFRLHEIGFVFQFFNLLPMLSAWENVAVPRLLDGQRLASARADAVELLTRVGLADRVAHRPAELSGGQMQRVALARALVMGPRIVLADEPTGNLDSETGRHILRLLADLAHEGDARAVIMVTHNLAAAGWSDRTIVLRDGDVVADGAPTEVLRGAEGAPAL